jgi:hypothetical protein
MKTSRQSSRLFFRALFAGTICIILVLVFSGSKNLQAQIYEPEGLNMPGAWNSWNNPPANNLALASATQVPGGRVVPIGLGIRRWQTFFSVAATGGDIVGGTYDWLFTSGPTTGPWGNKWSNVNVVMNTLQVYTKEGPANNNITVTDGKWYTMNWEDAGYSDTRAIFMETSAQPVDIASVTSPSGNVLPATPVNVTVTLASPKSIDEYVFLRYSTDAWVTSVILGVPVTTTTGMAQIPGQVDATTVSYYVFTSTLSSINTDFDLYTLKMNNNGGLNYSYLVTSPPVVPDFRPLNDVTVLSGTTKCYDAKQTITLAGGSTIFKVEATGRVDLIAGKNILMLPGTSVASTGIMIARITIDDSYCPPGEPGKSAESAAISTIPVNSFSVKVFPNPTPGNVVCDIQGIQENAQVRVELINIQGKTIHVGHFIGNGQYSLPLQGLPSGAYYIKAVTDEKVVTKILLKR